MIITCFTLCTGAAHVIFEVNVHFLEFSNIVLGCCESFREVVILHREVLHLIGTAEEPRTILMLFLGSLQVLFNALDRWILDQTFGFDHLLSLPTCDSSECRHQYS